MIQRRGLLPLVLPSVARVLPVIGNTKNGVMARKIKVKICVLPMLPNIIYFSYVISFFFLLLSLSLSLCIIFSYKLYFLAATAATAATWRNYAIEAATLAATKLATWQRKRQHEDVRKSNVSSKMASICPSCVKILLATLCCR